MSRRPARTQGSRAAWTSPACGDRWRGEPCSQSRAEACALPTGLRAAGLQTTFPETGQEASMFHAVPCLATTSHPNSGILPSTIQVEKERNPLPHSTPGTLRIPCLLHLDCGFFPLYLQTPASAHANPIPRALANV